MDDLTITNTISEIQDIVRSQPHVAPRGCGSKTGLFDPSPAAVPLELGGLSGMLEYQPEEYTFTALAGTPLTEVEQALAEHGQYLPFDPPLGSRGATLGGTVAAGLSGPGRYRYGGVRDFILGAQFIDGQGELVHSGGKVVKNAAGFDLSKWMVGSLGGYGALVVLSFKVFPRPAAYASVQADYPDLAAALDGLMRLTGAPFDLYGLDLVPDKERATLLARLGGPPETFPKRTARLEDLLASPATPDCRVLEGAAEASLWQAARECDWLPTGQALVKIPLTPGRVAALDARLGEAGATRRYSVGANLAWVAWPGTLEALEALLSEQQLAGLVVLGPPGKPRLGMHTGEAFARRVKQALDPAGKFGAL
jgi:glycolate oxidase FAD binding subunit